MNPEMPSFTTVSTHEAARPRGVSRGAELFSARIVGEGARTVVLGHGFGIDQTTWHAQVEALVGCGYRVALFDFAGATEHTLAAYQPDRHRTLYGFAEDLVLLMRAMDIRGATYIGHSLGGTIGVLACNGAPGLFDSLVLLASSARYMDDPAAGYVGGFTRESIDLLLASMRNDYVAWANGFAPLAMGNPDRPVLAREFTRRLLVLRPDIAGAVLSAAFQSDHRKDVQRLKVPVQVLQTESDVAVPLAAAQWLAAHSRAQGFTVIRAQGHFPHMSAVDEVNAAILKFLAAHGRV